MGTPRRSEIVSVAALSKAIDKAIKLAGERHDVAFDRANIIYNWEIIGRIAREVTPAARATSLDVASTVLKNLPGVQGQPAAVRLGRDILVGFIARGGTFSF